MKIDPHFYQKYGPWALLTGGAEGMGAAFADQIAGQGLSLVLVDRQAEKLETTAERLRKQYSIEVKAIVVDLADPDFLEPIAAACNGIDIGLLVSCAAVGEVGPFHETRLDALLAGVDVNVKVPLTLTYNYGNAMLRRGKGGIILISTEAAYHGSPFVASYAATKAYSLILGEALWYEMRKHGVDVLGFTPGATNTPGFRRGSPKLKEGEKNRHVMLPDKTAFAALAQLGKKPSARPSLRLTVETFFMTRLFNRRKAISLLGDKISTALTQTIEK